MFSEELVLWFHYVTTRRGTTSANCFVRLSMTASLSVFPKAERVESRGIARRGYEDIFSGDQEGGIRWKNLSIASCQRPVFKLDCYRDVCNGGYPGRIA